MVHKTLKGKLIELSKFIDADEHDFYAAHFTDVVHLYLINEIGICACYSKNYQPF